ncbi:DUF4232 domain-containing protein [Streptomyces palmae]|uniref:DUF4232 domain-containing protein n=1 Tax=Streptomyces palmae TaxID=1701085 RepID=A0A4Z0HE38_9ACTN|nr:DUF4232 domain-containing protein [Streptomyces palmae]TGB13894.1 DUF4232 domain-containing protein [Streptomyces palmae]
MSATTARTRVRLLAAATLALASFSLTACQDGGSGTRSEGRANTAHQSAAPAHSAKDAEEAPAAAKDDRDGTGSQKTGQTGQSGQSGGNAGDSGTAAAKPPAQAAPARTDRGNRGSGTATTCTSANTKVTVTQVSRPINHLLLTATNTGTAPCYAYYAPYLRFDDAQAATAFNEDSKPQAVVTLKPGESAYAGIRTSAADGGAQHGITAQRLGVSFANRDQDGSVGGSTNLTLPGGGVYVDDSAEVTYWQTSMDDALMW